MGVFKADEVDRYGGQGGAGYFSLKNDKDVARVRFLYNGVEDIVGYAVHEVEINGKKRYVNCLRSYNEPKSNCPFCREGRFTSVKLFIPLYNYDQEKVQVWERGKKFFTKMTSICSRYPDISSHIFEIERNGKPGSTETTYEIYEVEKDGKRVEDLDIEEPQVLGGLILDKTAQEMEDYLRTGEFVSEEQEEPVVRRRVNQEDAREVRRTPATTSRRGDRF